MHIKELMKSIPYKATPCSPKCNNTLAAGVSYFEYRVAGGRVLLPENAATLRI